MSISQFATFIANVEEPGVHDARSLGRRWICFETRKKGSSKALRKAPEDESGVDWPDAAASLIRRTLRLRAFSYRRWKSVLFEHLPRENRVSAQFPPASEGDDNCELTTADSNDLLVPEKACPD
jgi:hypothetical protein